MNERTPSPRERGEGPILLLGCLLLVACIEPTETPALTRLGPVSGSITAPVSGDAWVFLYNPGEGPPGPPAIPRTVTAVSAARLATDPRFVIANVPPNPWRLYGLLDVDGDFDATIDVLSQPTAGDRTSTPIAFQSQPGRGAVVPLEIDQLVPVDPPAFRLEGEDDLDVVLDPAVEALTPLTLVADGLDRFDPKRIGFTFGLVDADADMRPDDVDGDGTPDLSLQLFLRWLPRPGQLEAGTTVIVPLVFDPSPFIRTLEGRLGTTVTTSRLQAVMVPQAQALGTGLDGGPELRPFGTPPAGDYELVALQAGGQFWRVPNQLEIPSQRTRFHVDRESR